MASSGWARLGHDRNGRRGVQGIGKESKRAAGVVWLGVQGNGLERKGRKVSDRRGLDRMGMDRQESKAEQRSEEDWNEQERIGRRGWRGPAAKRGERQEATGIDWLRNDRSGMAGAGRWHRIGQERRGLIYLGAEHDNQNSIKV